MHNDGFVYGNRRCNVEIYAILADTPARNFITCFPAHNSCCAKCTQLGKTVDERRLRLDTNLILRTAATFREGMTSAFENIASPFETLVIDMVRQFPLDYLHLLCLEVMKGLILLSIGKNGKSEVALASLPTLNDVYTSFATCVPVAFARKPGSLDEASRWKATES